MSYVASNETSRREFLKTTSRAAAVSALAGVAIPHVHAAENNTIQVALVGCGGRGTGAAANALSTKSGPIKLVAMGDVFENRLASSRRELQRRFADQVDVPQERQFVGLDAYKKALDCLKPGDIAIFATPPGFRWVHFTRAIDKGLNVFMEKPVTVDGPTTRRMIQLASQAEAKNLKVGVGLMVRHCRGRQQLKQRLESGEIGEIIAMRAYRMAGPMVGFAGPNTTKLSDLRGRTVVINFWASSCAPCLAEMPAIESVFRRLDGTGGIGGSAPVQTPGTVAGTVGVQGAIQITENT